jgi:hypothetical protein
MASVLVSSPGEVPEGRAGADFPPIGPCAKRTLEARAGTGRYRNTRSRNDPNFKWVSGRSDAGQLACLFAEPEGGRRARDRAGSRVTLSLDPFSLSGVGRTTISTSLPRALRKR